MHKARNLGSPDFTTYKPAMNTLNEYYANIKMVMVNNQAFNHIFFTGKP